MLKHVTRFGTLSRYFIGRGISEMAGVEALLCVNKEIQRSIQEAKTQAHELEKLVEEYVKSALNQENKNLREIVEQLKKQLIKLEIANGIEQFPVQSEGVKGISEEFSCLKDNAEKPTTFETVKSGSNKEVVEVKGESKKDKKTIKKEPAKGESEEPPVDVGRLDLRIGKIVEVKKHPDADSLYVEQVDVGQGKTLTVVSGLVKYVPVEEMEGRMVVLLCNLKPAKMRGITSEAMVMCASTPEKVEVLLPPPGVQPGDLVHVEGFPRVPDKVLNPKKKIFEAVAPDLKTDSNRNATYKSAIWTIPGKGNVTSLSLTEVNIK